MQNYSWLDSSGYFKGYDDNPGNIASNLVIAFYVTDVVLGTLIYIAGGLKENRWLLHIYYFYSISGSVLTVMLATVNLGLSTRGWLSFDTSVLNVIIGALTVMGCFVTIALQVYFVLLLRKEIVNSYKVAFSNQRSLEYPIQLKDKEGQKEKGNEAEKKVKNNA